MIVRLTYVLLSAGALGLLLTRWRTTRVLTRDRRLLFVFLFMELSNAILAGVLKIVAGMPADSSSYVTVIVQGYLAVYLFVAVPRANRYPWPAQFWRRACRSLSTARPSSVWWRPSPS